VNYAVEWDTDAEQELAALWLGASNRGDVTRAAHALEQQLRVDAHLAGESRSGDRRILFLSPLGILFEVFSASRVVRVLHVWHLTARRR
jgi:hypothetical protein